MEHGRRKENRHGGEGRKLYSGVGSGVEAIYRGFTACSEWNASTNSLPPGTCSPGT